MCWDTPSSNPKIDYLANISKNCYMIVISNSFKEIHPMKIKITILCAVTSLLVFYSPKSALVHSEEKAFTFSLADVLPAEDLLKEVSYEKAVRRMVRDVESYPQLEKTLVPTQMHAFVDAVGRAYSEHRPLVISPDMIWLLICQGFSQHVNNDPEKLRAQFVTHAGKKELVVYVDPREFIKGRADNPFQKVFPAFTRQIEANTLAKIHDIVTAPFSTTGPVEKAAFEITLMDAMKSFFSYTMIVICGIPQITLEGSVQDWQAVLARTKKLRHYQLDWWIDELIPVLEEFVMARAGKVNRSFWNSIYFYHAPKSSMPCSPDRPFVYGWIIKFFPYLPGGLKNPFLQDARNMKDGLKIREFHTGVSSTEFTWIDRVRNEKYDMEFLAGFIGIDQDDQTKALRPEIGWAVREAEKN
jgi:hypothetical protein